MERDLPLAVRVLLLGAEGSGKTSLTQQLKRLGSSGIRSCASSQPQTSSSSSSNGGGVFNWTIAEGGSLSIAPTTGQDVESIALPLPPPRGPTINAEGKPIVQSSSTPRVAKNTKKFRGSYNDRINDNKMDEYSDAEGEEEEDIENRNIHLVTHHDNIGGIQEESEYPPQQQEVRKSSGGDIKKVSDEAGAAPPSSQRDLSVIVAASMKEIGGRMIAVWPRFIKKMQDDKTGPPIRCLIYVIDVANVAFLPQTAIELQEILHRQEDVAQWPALILLNKVCSPSALNLALVLSTLGIMDQVPAIGGGGGAGGGGGDWDRSLLDSAIGGNHNTGCRLQLSEKVTLMTVDTWSGLGLVEVLDWLRGHAYGFNSLTRDISPNGGDALSAGPVK